MRATLCALATSAMVASCAATGTRDDFTNHAIARTAHVEAHYEDVYRCYVGRAPEFRASLWTAPHTPRTAIYPERRLAEVFLTVRDAWASDPTWLYLVEFDGGKGPGTEVRAYRSDEGDMLETWRIVEECAETLA